MKYLPIFSPSPGAHGFSSHLPIHSSREILIIFGSLTTCDPNNIHDTLDACVANKIRISVVALAAEMKICRELCDKTGGGWFCTDTRLLAYSFTVQANSGWR
jgi:hypothetical protein